MRSFSTITVGLGVISFGFLVSAATISTTASCTSLAGSQIVHGSSVAACSISAPDGSGASGTAVSGGSINFPNPVITGQTEVATEAVTSPPHSVYAPHSIVTATYDDDLTFEISGASGSGTVIPMLFLFAGIGQDPDGAWAQASFGSVKVSAAAPNGPSGFVNNTESFPFFFGVPFTVHLHLESSAVAVPLSFDLPGGGSSHASFDGLGEVRLADGEGVPNAVITQIITPEPSTLALCVTGIGLVWFSTRKNTRARTIHVE